MSVGRHLDEKALFSPGAYPSFYDDPDFDRRACRDVDPEVFFPEGGNGHATAARRVCARCPLRVRCRAWALSRPWTEVHGVWGGTTQQERKKEQEGKRVNCPRCRRRVGVSRGIPARHFAGRSERWCT